ncbi:Hsp20/alpha crystallin family protein [Saprospira grandis]|uniref:Hsp20/alpha crystallin family protein n=1 Tax=Saprospira grandis TaxID=1008 RepID=UPI0022DD5E2B|nr:Hsp20/alpha crystallin family protein [Saprospira grandis]WBM73354.1 Hsp20/alpha crystallin family protein [Saprospira grandis]
MQLPSSSGGKLPAFPMYFDDPYTRKLFEWSVFQAKQAQSVPAVNLLVQSDQYILELAAPGFAQEDFVIEWKSGALRVAARQSAQQALRSREAQFLHREFAYDQFERVFALPMQDIVASQLSASYEAGVLRIYLPKQKPSPPELPQSVDWKK